MRRLAPLTVALQAVAPAVSRVCGSVSRPRRPMRMLRPTLFGALSTQTVALCASLGRPVVSVGAAGANSAAFATGADWAAGVGMAVDGASAAAGVANGVEAAAGDSAAEDSAGALRLPGGEGAAPPPP